MSNTTISRPESLKSNKELSTQAGGLSGEPLKQLSTQCVKDMAILTKGNNFFFMKIINYLRLF